MKIALVLEQFDPRRGGLEQWTARFSARLAQRGHEVHVVAGRFDERALSDSIVAHPIDCLGSRLAFAEAAEMELLSIAPDIIHDMGSGWFCDVFHPHGGSRISLAQRKLMMQPAWLRPIKRRIDRLLPRGREYQTLMSRQYVDNGQILVALSRQAAEDFRRLHGVPPERIRIVYNGVDTERFSPRHRSTHRRAVRRQLGIADDAVLALIVAHNFRLKGLPTLLRAMRRLSAEGVPIHLAVVGGKRLQPWQRKARRLGVGERVTFLGAQDETVPYYAAADVCVHPTFHDMCSLVVLEAAACGLPIVTTRLNGAAELLDDGVEGLLITNPADCGELAARLRDLCDADLRQRMGTAARQMALRHTMDRNVEEILAVYEDVVDLRRRRAASATAEARRPQPFAELSAFRDERKTNPTKE